MQAHMLTSTCTLRHRECLGYDRAVRERTKHPISDRFDRRKRFWRIWSSSLFPVSGPESKRNVLLMFLFFLFVRILSFCFYSFFLNFSTQDFCECFFGRRGGGHIFTCWSCGSKFFKEMRFHFSFLNIARHNIEVWLCVQYTKHHNHLRT